jgi:uncharacterized repeat protein (TIGR03803 family)
MQTPIRSTQKFFYRVSAMLVLLTLATLAASAQSTFATIHEFTGTDGASPVGNLVSDAAGNLYGVTTAGGQQNPATCSLTGSGDYCGTAFKLTRSSSGKWQETVIYEFQGGNDGGIPLGGLTIDAHGNLYGTAAVGGGEFNGVVFELSPSNSGSWTETVLYYFVGGSDGYFPEGNLIFDKAGNLYGTTSGGGTGFCGLGIPCGTVFELSPHSNGFWTEKILYNFSELSDGAVPSAGLIFDRHGNLYGTTSIGGNLTGNCGYPAFGCGTVFTLSPNSTGGWSKNTVYIFTDGADGAAPYSSLTNDTAGNLYGTASAGGNLNGCNGFGCGVVYRLSPNSSGGWTETVIHTFQLLGTRIGQGGGVPLASLTFDAAHNLYGTASQGGILAGGAAGHGVVFKLSRTSSNSWKETVLHTFSGPDGSVPNSGLLFDSAGNLFGTTAAGGTSNGGSSGCGSDGCGVVFDVKP